MALASLVILSIFKNQFNHRKTYLFENWIFGRKCTYLFRIFISIWEIWHFFCDQKIFNCEMLIKYCAILFMSVSISVSGETKICLSFPMCNDHHNESMRNQMVRKDQISNFENQWSFSAGTSCNFTQWVEIILFLFLTEAAYSHGVLQTGKLGLSEHWI